MENGYDRFNLSRLWSDYGKEDLEPLWIPENGENRICLPDMSKRCSSWRILRLAPEKTMISLNRFKQYYRDLLSRPLRREVHIRTISGSFPGDFPDRFVSLYFNIIWYRLRHFYTYIVCESIYTFHDIHSM